MPKWHDYAEADDGIVEIKVDGHDLTEWFYSDRFDLDGGWQLCFDRKAMLNIRDQFNRIDPMHTQNGIRLRPVTRQLKPMIGSVLMRLTAKPGRLIKELIRINKIESKTGDRYYVFELVWPQCGEGFEGFFSEDCLFELEDGQYSIFDPELFFHYVYTGGQGDVFLNRPDREKSTFEIVYELAQDLDILVQAWSLVHNPHMHEGWSADPLHEYWRHNYNPEDEKRKHWRVFLVLWSVLHDGLMHEVEEIFDKQRFGRDTWWGHHDLITPLLDKIQEAILHKILQDESLAELLFPENEPHLNRRMKVIFERFYGPKAMVHIETPHKPDLSPPPNWKLQAKLKGVIALIRRGAYAGERQAALKAYERLLGRPYCEEEAREQFPRVFIRIV